MRSTLNEFFNKLQHYLTILCAFAILFTLTGCMTGSTLRTARVLDKGQLEVSVGLAGAERHAGQVIIAAYGVTDDVEIEGRWEDDYIAITPRLQLLRSETSPIDCVGLCELGYSDSHKLHGGPGIMIGRRWDFFEPYASYRFRYADEAIQYMKFGSRIYFPYPWKQCETCPSNWFVGLEVGPTFYTHGTQFEWAFAIGFKY